MKPTINRSQLIARTAKNVPKLKKADVDKAVRTIFKDMIEALGDGRRVELRGFGVFNPRDREERIGRNPRTGQNIPLPKQRMVHFRAGTELNQRINSKKTSGSTDKTD